MSESTELSSAPIFKPEWLKNCIYTLDWKRRLGFFLGSLFCRYQRVKGYDGWKLQYTGWFDWRKGITYITWEAK